MIGLLDGRLGLVDEARLLLLPALVESLAPLCRQRPNRQLLDALGAVLELGLGLAPRAALLHDTVVLRTESAMQLHGAPLAEIHPYDEQGGDDCDDEHPCG